VRELGYDPERLIEEQIEDNASADAGGLVFDTDGRHARAGQAAPEMNGGGNEPE
jgi:capsid protein